MFRDRQDAGQQLADKLSALSLRDPVVLGIPRGGIVPAVEIARTLHAELDVILAHKLRSPMQPELAFGAIGEDGHIYLNHHVREIVGVTESYLDRERRMQSREIKRRQDLFRSGKPAASIPGRSVILTDDGIATGSTMFTAIEVVKAQQPYELIVAVPVAPPSRLQSVQELCDRVICLEAPDNFMAVGQFYETFLPVSDEQVVDLLREHSSTLHR